MTTQRKQWVSWEEFYALFPGLSLWSVIDFQRIGGLTPGSIPFADATGMLTEYNTGLFFDETNVRLGVGTGGPVCTGHLRSAVCADYAGLHPDTVLLLENDDNVTLQFQCSTTGEARIRFCDDDFNPSAGTIDYEFTNNYMVFGVATAINMYLTPTGLGVGNIIPTNELHVSGPGTDEGGLAGGSDVVARFRQTVAGHCGISVDALANYDPVLYLAENGEAQWDIRNDASESDEFQIRYQGRAVVNRTDFIIDASGNVEIPTGNLSIRSQNELRFYDNGNYVGFEAPALGADQIWVLPTADGNLNDLLKTSGAGVLSWTPAGAGDVTAGANLTDLAIVRGDGGAKGVKTSTAIITDAGEMYNPSQPAFLAYNSATDLDVTGDSTVYTVDFDTEVFDQGGDFAADTFTAPIDGRYLLAVSVAASDLDADTYERFLVSLITSNRTYYIGIDSGLDYFSTGAIKSISTVVVVDMDANDTAHVTLTVAGGAKSVDCHGHATALYTCFSGTLIC